MFFIIFATLVFFQNTESYYRCPNFGKLNYTCVYFDYCDSQMNLVCGNGSCG